MTQINQLFNRDKWNYFTRLFGRLNQYARENYNSELTTKEIAAAVYESSGKDPTVKKAVYEEGKCPK